MKSTTWISRIGSVLWLFWTSAQAQNPAPAYTRTDRTLTGFYPTGVYHFGEMETVNTQSGNVMLRIPIASLPAGHGGLSAGITLLYNSQDLQAQAQVWECPGRNPAFQWTLQPDLLKGGWRYGIGYELVVTEASTSATSTACEIKCPDKGATHKFQYGLVFPDGSYHALEPYNGSASAPNPAPTPAPLVSKENGYWNLTQSGLALACRQESIPGTWSLVSQGGGQEKLTFYTTDGTYIRVEATPGPILSNWTAYMPDGSRVTGGAGGVQLLVDRNGNKVTLGTAWNPVTQTLTNGIQDDLGRSISLLSNSAAGTDDIIAQGFGSTGTLTWKVYWRNIRPNREYRPYSSKDTFANAPATQPMPDRRVVSRIDFPATALVNGTPLPATQAYLFSYGENATPVSGNPNLFLTPLTGELYQFTLPSGASTLYEFAYHDVATSQWSDRNQYDRVIRNRIKTKKLLYTQPSPAPGGQANPGNETWTYNIAENGVFATVTAPDGAVTSESYSAGLLRRMARPDGSVVEKVWFENRPAGPVEIPVTNLNLDVFNPFPKKTYVSAANASGSPVTTAITEMSLDANGNPFLEKAYGAVAYADAHDLNGLPKEPTTLTELRRTTRTFYTPAIPNAPVGVLPCTGAHYGCANYAPNVRSVSTEIVEGFAVLPGGAPQRSMTKSCYDDAFTRANLVNRGVWDSQVTAGLTDPNALINCAGGRGSAHSSALVTTRTYDARGNLETEQDPKGFATIQAYGTIPQAQCNSILSGQPPSYPSPYPVSVTNALGQTMTRGFDCKTGVMTSETDANAVTRSMGYDRFGRLTSSVVNGELATFRYSDTERYLVQVDDVDLPGDQKRFTVERFDALGRKRLLQVSENGTMPASETDGILTQYRYSAYAAGDDSYVSNPYRASETGEPTTGWTVTRKDRVGRVTQVKRFAGIGLPDAAASANAGTDQMVYDGLYTTLTDAAGKTRRERRDALGRLDEVLEANLYTTKYEYNQLDNLVRVKQGPNDQQVREFEYTSVGKLRKARNVEAPEIAYTYDKNGNLATRTQAGIKTSLGYDGLNRMMSKEYRDAVTDNADGLTPWVRYCYDGLQSVDGGACEAVAGGVARSIGRLTGVSSAASTYRIGSYDAVGRVTQSSQTTKRPPAGTAVNAALQYSYTAGGALRELVLPSQRKVTYQYDAAGRVSGMKRGDAAAVESYASQMSYHAHGAMKSWRLGNGLVESQSYNTRLQVETMSLGSLWSLKNVYGGTANNGNVVGQEMSVPGVGPVVYTGYEYDGMNRLTRAAERLGSAPAAGSCAGSLWCYGYDHGVYGNRRVVERVGAGTGAGPWDATSYNEATNRVSTAGFDYDGAGNVKQIPGGTSLKYDGEQRLAAHCPGESPASCAPVAGGSRTVYTYDGDGRRVRQQGSSGSDVVYVYDAYGQLAAEYGSAATAGLRYLTADHLGSTRVVTDGTGVAERYDYDPYGQELTPVVGSWRTAALGYSGGEVNPRFTGKERDAETKLDHLLARYYSPAQGAFTGVDPGPPRPNDPQSWNRYSYTRGNPLRRTDPDGLYDRDVHLDMTHALALGAGFTLSRAAAIAAANQFVDDDPARSPLPTLGELATGNLRFIEAGQQWHFPRDGRLLELQSTYRQQGTAEALGDYLHVMQDSFSHASYNPPLGHALTHYGGHQPDLTFLRPDLAMAMAHKTYLTLIEARGTVKHAPHRIVPFSLLQRPLLTYFMATDAKAKKKALQGIYDAVRKYQQEHDGDDENSPGGPLRTTLEGKR